VTITKPIATVTGVAEYPSSAPSIAYPAEYPASPVSSGKPAHPAVPEASKAAYPTVPEASKMAEYPVAPAPSKAPEYPAHPAMPSAAQPALSSPAAEYPSYPVGNDYPKKPVEHEAASTMHVTFSKVSVPAYTPAPYMPAGPAKNATSVYVPMPTGTGKPAMPSSSVPAEFEGAASRAGVGFMMLVGAVGAVLVM
jgi:chitinase